MKSVAVVKMDLNEAAQAIWSQTFSRALPVGALKGVSDDFMADVRHRYVRGEITMEKAAEEVREHYEAALESAGPPF